MNAIHPAFAHKLPHSRVFRAWRKSPTGNAPAIPLEIGQPTDLGEAVIAATASFIAHKDTLIIHEADYALRKGTQHAFVIRKKKPIWVRNPQTGVPERAEQLYADKLFALPVDNFEPTRQFDPLRDCATGVDRSLVEG